MMIALKYLISTDNSYLGNTTLGTTRLQWLVELAGEWILIANWKKLPWELVNRMRRSSMIISGKVWISQWMQSIMFMQEDILTSNVVIMVSPCSKAEPWEQSVIHNWYSLAKHNLTANLKIHQKSRFPFAH